VEGEKKENTICPVCREEFDTFYKQGEAEDEGSWYLHNCMRTEEGLFHPECHKDKDNAMDVTVTDTSMDEGIKTEPKEEPEEGMDQAKPGDPAEQLSVADCVIKQESPVPPSVEEDVLMKDVEVKKEEVSKEENGTENVSEDNGPLESIIKIEEGIKIESVEGETEKVEEEVSEEGAEETKANKSLIDDAVDGGDNSLTAPVVNQAKVNINITINSSVPVERRESLLSQPSENEESSEFDVEAVVVPSKSQDEMDLSKPRMKGKKFTIFPPAPKDSDLSGLCSIM